VTPGIRQRAQGIYIATGHAPASNNVKEKEYQEKGASEQLESCVKQLRSHRSIYSISEQTRGFFSKNMWYKPAPITAPAMGARIAPQNQ